MLAGVIDALGDRTALGAHAAPMACLDAAVALLGALLREDSLGRERADELLVADALVTYAFEAAATSASDLDEFAGMVMETPASAGFSVTTDAGKVMPVSAIVLTG